MRVVIVGLLLCSSCALVFQDRLKSEYDGRSEPQCSTGAGWAGLDLALAGLNVLGAAAASDDNELSADEKSAYMIGGIVWGALHLVSGVSGFAWASTCKDAYKEWNDDGQNQKRVDDLAERTKLARSLAVDQPPPKPAPPRGYFCATSATSGLCAREKTDCETAREAALSAVPDLAACAIVESAHCFDREGRERCFPTAELCAARGGEACVERK